MTNIESGWKRVTSLGGYSFSCDTQEEAVEQSTSFGASHMYIEQHSYVKQAFYFHNTSCQR